VVNSAIRSVSARLITLATVYVASCAVNSLAWSGESMKTLSTMMYEMNFVVERQKSQEFYNELGAFSKSNGFKLDLTEMGLRTGCMNIMMVRDDLVLDGNSEFYGADGGCDAQSFRISINTNYYKGAVLTGNDQALRDVARRVAESFRDQLAPTATVIIREKSN
jgi:hypothetical protein